MTSFDETVSVQDQYESQLMSLPGVIGVGIGECDREPCLKVFVTEMTPELETQIPQELDGVKVEIEVTGPIEALPATGATSTSFTEPIQSLPGTGAAMKSFDEIIRVQAQYEDQLMSLPGVVGVGIGECGGAPCFNVFVVEATSELQNQIPQELDGIKVEIKETGPINTLP